MLQSKSFSDRGHDEKHLKTARALNFSAGPSTLPLQVLLKAQEELLLFDGTGASIMELSHRGKTFDKVCERTKILFKELTNLPGSHELLFLQGGASQHFAQIPLNFLHDGMSAEYVLTGTWGEKAHLEACKLKHAPNSAVRASTSSAQKKNSLNGGTEVTHYERIPYLSELKLSERTCYVHFTSNETVHGVQFDLAEKDEANIPLLQSKDLIATNHNVIADMSSDFLSQPIDLSPYAFIYAGAQKNLGPSGVVAAVAKREFLEQGRKDLPKIWQYRTSLETNSLYNTPCTFSIYLMGYVLEWITEHGGLTGMAERNQKKADTLYKAIDASKGFYRCPVDRSSRSKMNVVFYLPDRGLEESFLIEAQKHDMIGLKGHRLVGGIRASIYNAVEPEWVDTLAQFMAEFVKNNG